MKKILTAVVILTSALAFADDMKKDAKAMDNKGAAMKTDTKAMGTEMKATGTEMKNDAAANMANWKAPKVTKEDKAGLDAFYKEMEAAMMKGDMAACAQMVAPQIMMVTDGSKGGMSAMWTREQWQKMMTDTMAGMPKDMKMSAKHKYTFLSDNLAMSTNDVTSTMGKTKTTYKNGDVLMKKDGKWMVTSMIEGGWGDMMGAGTGGTGSMTK
jgi:hypothetical protein